VKVVLATANPDKAKEIQAILGSSFDLVPRPADVPDVEETGDTLEENARLKAVALVEATGLPAISDDTGLEVEALGGAPGVYSARYAGDDATYESNCSKLLRELEGVAAGERRARFRTVAFFRAPDGREVVAEGIVDGVITSEPRGDNGFGYDPVFVPDDDPSGRTFAEMGADKHAISHRGRAFRRLAELLGAG
jgi:XTP/dITP diphosphohydrolase